MEGIFKNKKSEKIRFMDGMPQMLTGGFLCVTGLLIYLSILDALYPSSLNQKLSVISLFFLIALSVLFLFYYEKMKNFIREKFIYEKTGYFAPLPLPRGIKIFLFLSLLIFLLFMIFGVNKGYFEKLILLPHLLMLSGIFVFFLYSFVFDFLFSFLLSFGILFLKTHPDIKFALILFISGFVLIISGAIRWMSLRRG